nr:hypothetical protein [Tanacetum cinerariifolium]
MVAILEKSDAAEGFEQIIDFLCGSYINHAHTVNPHVYISCIKQFWNTAVVKRSSDVTRLQALVDKKRIVVTKEVVHEILQLNDVEGVICLPNDEIFAGLARMGYEKPSTKLTFYKAFFSTQWKFFKRTSWNEFSSAMASALICLSSGQWFNFSKYIFESLVRNVDSSSKFYMYPCFIQLIIQTNIADLSKHTNRYISPVLTQKVPAQGDDVHEHAAKEVATDVVPPTPTSPSPSSPGRISVDMVQDEGIELVVDHEKDVEVEGRHADKQAEIYNIDLDHSSKVLSMQEDDTEVQEAVEVVTTAKLMTEVVTTAATQVEKDAEYAKKLQEELDNEHEEAYKNIDWNVALDHVQSKDPQYIKRYHRIKKKPQTESEARKNMISYLKNTEGYKMKFFKGKTYDEILPIFQASINETPAQKEAKRGKLSEEAQEADDLRRRLEIVQDEDDDVFVEAIPLAQKVLVVDYQIVVIDNRPKYKIIRADDTHQFYISFTTRLKNFDREDLEALWRIVKDRFSTSKPTNFSDEYLLLTLKTMFGELDE